MMSNPFLASSFPSCKPKHFKSTLTFHMDIGLTSSDQQSDDVQYQKKNVRNVLKVDAWATK